MSTNKSQLVRAMVDMVAGRAKRADRKNPRKITRREIRAIVTAVFQVIGDALVRGDRVVIPSFGTWVPAEHRSRDETIVSFNLSNAAQERLFDYLLGLD